MSKRIQAARAWLNSRWRDPEYRKRMSQSRKAAWLNLAYRRKQSRRTTAQLKIQWADPAYRHRLIRSMKVLWADPVQRNRVRRKTTAAWRRWWTKGGAKRRMWAAQPNVLERRVQKALNRWFPKEWRYNRGAVVLGGFVPDFINVNGRKAVVEVFGDYWHRNDSAVRKRMHYRRLGYQCVIVWEKEFKKDPTILRDRVEAL